MKNYVEIVDVVARQVLDSRCFPTVEVEVYLEDGMKDIAMPLDMATANGGVGCLPTGSRIAIPNGAIVRAFTYWEKVNDVDLSCWLVDKDFNNIKEFNWSEWNDIRNYRHYHTNWDLNAVNFSGDQTSGYNGGSEYFDERRRARNVKFELRSIEPETLE